MQEIENSATIENKVVKANSQSAVNTVTPDVKTLPLK
jgi:hypothetical protein